MFVVLMLDTMLCPPNLITRQLYKFIVRVNTASVSSYWHHVVDDPRLIQLPQSIQMINPLPNLCLLVWNGLVEVLGVLHPRGTRLLGGTLNKSVTGGGSERDQRVCIRTANTNHITNHCIEEKEPRGSFFYVFFKTKGKLNG